MGTEKERVVWVQPRTCHICGREFKNGDTYMLVDKRKKLAECHKCYLASQYATVYCPNHSELSK